MAIALNPVAKNAAVRPAQARGVGAAILSFFNMLGAAIEASRSVHSGRRPSNDVLKSLGINPESFPRQIRAEY